MSHNLATKSRGQDAVLLVAYSPRGSICTAPSGQPPENPRYLLLFLPPMSTLYEHTYRRFPLQVAASNAGVICVDWTARETRYQADRSFEVLDGSCSRLEVTEIGTADSEIFLPEEKFL